MDHKKKYLIFLDIDGVLTSNRVHNSWDNEYKMWSKFDPIAVEFFNKIHDTYPVEFVCMSTWIDGLDVTDPMITHWIFTCFKNAGFRGKFAEPWKTNPTNDSTLKSSDRAIQVKSYLNSFTDGVTDFLLFDDNRFRFKEILGKNRLIHTDPDNGLLFKHMLNAQSIMGTWQKR